MIPEHDINGLLPPGIHACTLDEVRARLCFNRDRQRLLDGLCRLLAEWWPQFGLTAVVLIDGRFVRQKPVPADIDVVFELDPATPEVEALTLVVTWMKDKAALARDYHADVWVRHQCFPGNNICDFFQYVGDKASAELNLPRTHPKGILRIQP